MKKFNKILALGLAGASLLTGGFMLSGCDITEDKDTTKTEQEQDEQKVVSSISINADSLPSYIIKGKFNRTNVKVTVTYEDNTTKVIDVTESMFNETDKEKLKNVGQYNVTVNHGGKTATMYANVVDERYLLKEVVEANLNKDVTITYDDEIMKFDADNKIIYYSDNDGYESWVWLNNNVCYNYETEEGINKELGSSFDKYSQDWYTMSVFNILNGVDEDGDAWTVNSIEKDGLNYILTATQGGDCQYKYYFNEDFMYKVEELDGGHTYISNYNYSILNLEVPNEIKVLESSATINIENAIDDLKWGVVEDYLKSDFKMNVFDASTNRSYTLAEHDADSKIFITHESDNPLCDDLYWINGNYYYWYSYESSSINKRDVYEWQYLINAHCFTFDEGFNSNNITVDISKDREYYELVLTSEDSDGEIWEYKYVFNNDEISKINVKCDGQYMGSYTYNKTNVVLEVPADIKALESSAQ